MVRLLASYPRTSGSRGPGTTLKRQFWASSASEVSSHPQGPASIWEVLKLRTSSEVHLPYHFKCPFWKRIQTQRIHELFKSPTLSSLAGMEESAMWLWSIQHTLPDKRQGVGHGTQPFLDGIRFPIKCSPRIASLPCLFAYSCWACTHSPRQGTWHGLAHVCTPGTTWAPVPWARWELGHATVCSLGSSSTVYQALTS